MPEQVDTVELERRPHLANLLDKTLDAPQRWIVGAFRLATTELIVEDDRAFITEALSRSR